ncbi:MAG TPA: PilZ domain-containing protein [Desulfobulbus sp.]|nr:PilZ domain-containing protein [Desulfobulbus sp.]
MEQRQFQRFPLRCRLKVQGKNQSGHSFVETTELINISGGGALFSTRMRDHYVQGQTIKTNILLPGTPDIQGSMTTSAKVISINNRIDSSDDKPNGCIQVAVRFLEPFKLLRRNEPATVDGKQRAVSR